MQAATRWSGASLIVGAIVAGAGALLHPAGETAAYTREALWVPSHVLIAVGLPVLTFGFTGLYAVHVREMGRLGLAAFVITTVGLIWAAGIALGVGAIVQPLTAASAPELWEIDGPLFTHPGIRLLLAANYVWTAGVLLMAVALLRAGVRPFWPAWMLVGGAVFGLVRAVVLATVPAVLGTALPYLAANLLVIVIAVGVIGLGWELRRVAIGPS